MNKRIIAALLSVAIIFPGINAIADFSDIPVGTNESRIVDIISDLGIMEGYEDGKFRPDQAVTRAEFVTVIHNALSRLNDTDGGSKEKLVDFSDGFRWNDFFYGDGSSELTLMYPGADGDTEEAVVKKVFSDVTEEHWAYENIRDIAMIGCVNGYSDGSFKPENTVTYNEAVKIILSICGYSQYAEQYGGYPKGYNDIANAKKLYVGISALGDMPMSRMDIATLIYNTFTLELSPTVIDKNADKKNFLNDIMGVYMLEGTLTSTDVTSIYGDEPNMDYVAEIGDSEFIFDDSTDVRDYIGQDIRVFLKKNSEDKYYAESFEPTGMDTINEIDISSLDENNPLYNNKIYYYKDESRGKLSNVKFRDGTVLIYNGKFNDTDLGGDFFKGFNQGTVKVIEKKKLGFDIIVVENYESGYADTINTKTMAITDANKAGTGISAVIELDSRDPNISIKYKLLDEKGNKIAIESMKSGAINYYVNGNYVKVYYTNNKVSGVISGVSGDGEKTYVKIGDKKYPFAKQFLEHLGYEPKSGINATVYLDKYGEIVWFDDSVSLAGYVYLIKIMLNTDDENALLTYYDFSTSQVKEKVPTLADVRFVNQLGESGKRDYETLYNELTDYDDIIRITLNEEKISKIELPLDSSNKENPNRLKLVVKENFNNEGKNFLKNYSYDGRYFVDDSAYFIKLPYDRTEYEKYKKGSRTGLMSSGGGNFLQPRTKMYSFDVDAPYVNLVVEYPKGASDNPNEYTIDDSPFIVLDRQVAINDDDELCDDILVCYAANAQEYQYSIPYKDGQSILDNAYNATRTGEKMEVGKGDIIQFGYNRSGDGSICSATVWYDADGVNPAWEDDPVYDLGSVPGTTGFVENYKKNPDGSYALDGKGNKQRENYFTSPIRYTNGEVSAYDNLPGQSNNHQSVAVGYVHSIKDGLIMFTTQNLRKGLAERNTEDFYWAYNKLSYGDNKIRLIEISKREVTYESVLLSDIRTYEHVGKNCDKAFIYTVSGALATIVVIRD